MSVEGSALNVARSAPRGAVFLSYASQDAEAARRIAEALRAAGAEVWFDQSELAGGDAWDAKIRAQIGLCALFLPLISANTQARLEGYFRLEWKLAAQRTHTMADEKTFLLPILLDGTRDAEAKVPAEFKAVQWTKLPGGETPPVFCARVQKLLSGSEMEAGRPRPVERGEGAASPEKRGPSKWWWVPAIFGVTMALLLVLKEGRKDPAPPPVLAQSAAPSLSEAGPSRSSNGLNQAKPGAKPVEDPMPAAAAAPTANEKSVAVLAFANLSDDKGNEYFSDGISEELLNVLAKVPGLKVTARTSSFHFKGKDTPIPEIAQQLGVAYVVEGSVRKQGNKVRITAQLIKAADGFHVWSDTFTRDLKDVFAVQDEIAGLIAGNLRAKMAISSGRLAVRPEAYTLVLQARHAAQSQSSEGWKQAVGLYRQAVELEPGYALAWAELARCYVLLGRFHGLPMAGAMGEARGAAQKALQLDPDQPAGLAVMGWIQRTADWDWPGAQRSFRRALELAPDDLTVMTDAAVCFFNIGRTEEAVALAQRALERDPLNPQSQWARGWLAALQGHYEEGIPPLRRAIELAPTADEYHAHLARTLVMLGRLDEAEVAAQLEPKAEFRLNVLALISQLRGDTAAEVGYRQELIKQYGGEMAGYIATLCALEGRRDEAFAWLDRAYRNRDGVIAWSKINIFLAGLHDDPRWPIFLHRLGLADEQLK